MIDYFALALSHFLIVVALIRLLGRDELDQEDQAKARGSQMKSQPAEEPGS